MAKDKTKTGSKAGKASKSGKAKIPKTIAGVKIPKTLRDSGKAAIKLSRNPMARELLSAGLMAAAAAVAANGRARKAAREGGAQAADAMGEAAGQAADNAAKIKEALVGAAGLAAQRFFGLDKGAEPQDAGATGTKPPKAEAVTDGPASMQTEAQTKTASVPDAVAVGKPQTKRKPASATPPANGKA